MVFEGIVQFRRLCNAFFVVVTSRLFRLFKVLVVLHPFPAAAPYETMLHKELVAEIVGGNLVVKPFVAVGIFLSGFRLYDHLPLRILSHTRVVERIDINGHAFAMGRQHLAACHLAEVEARCVVVQHRLLVVGIIVIHQHHAFNRVGGLVQGLEYGYQVMGYTLVANQFAHDSLSLQVAVNHFQISQR